MLTSSVIALCLAIRKHYDSTRRQLRRGDEIFAAVPCGPMADPPRLDREAPTAVLMVGRSRGAGMHTLLWIQRLFPDSFRNFVFLSVGAVDTASYGGTDTLGGLQRDARTSWDYYVIFCHEQGLAAQSYEAYGIDRVQELTKLALRARAELPNSVFFSGKLIFVRDNWFTRILHNQTPLAMQRILHVQGLQMVILPMKVDG